MIFFPQQQLTKIVISSKRLYTAAGALYIACLLAWLPAGLGQHLYSIAGETWAAQNKAAAHVYLDGLRRSVPTAHSIILCFMVGPLGLMSHFATRAITGEQPGQGQHTVVA
ncbi:hypothetical protein WJX84_007702 [Apatococcus fuscideae]|uniref:Uncharacterized protein n=1 Tax=Apatococcus fuscideae TaxID=2026836 RepID=A0AAW1TEI9_9CHLO